MKKLIIIYLVKLKNTHLIFFIFFFIFGGITLYFIIKKGGISLEIQACNNTDKTIDELQILRENISLSQIIFSDIAPKKCTDYQTVQNLHQSLGIQIYTSSDIFSQEKYQLIPHDLTGVEYIKSGKYSVNINSLETIKPAIIEYNNAIKYETTKDTTEKNIDFKIKLCNKTEKDIENASISPGPSFGSISSGKCSDFQETEGLYKIIPLQIFVLSSKENIYGEKYQSIPIDYVGETLLEAGSYTININSLNSSPENATVLHDNGVKYEIVED